MSFQNASGDDYDLLMGRYSQRLAPHLVDWAGIESGARVVDVGCGPGALTSVLAERFGADQVAAADPSARFVADCRSRVPGADVREAPAEQLPWDDDAFDAALAQLVVNFMADPDAGVAEMARVVRSGGIVAGCTWGLGDAMPMIDTFGQAALAIDPVGRASETPTPHRSPESLAELWTRCGLGEVDTAWLEVAVSYDDFADFWAGFERGVTPMGAYVAGLDAEQRGALRAECLRRLGSPSDSFTLQGRACAVRGRVA